MLCNGGDYASLLIWLAASPVFCSFRSAAACRNALALRSGTGFAVFAGRGCSSAQPAGMIWNHPTWRPRVAFPDHGEEGALYGALERRLTPAQKRVLRVTDQRADSAPNTAAASTAPASTGVPGRRRANSAP